MRTKLDDHGQPKFGGFNQQRNINKALVFLKGYLQGIQADQHLNQYETVYLNLWIKDHFEDQSQADLVLLENQLDTALEDGVITAQEQQGLLNTIDTILHQRDWHLGDDDLGLHQAETSTINEFLGFLVGIAVDHQLQPQEIEKLKAWFGNPIVRDELVFAPLITSLLECEKTSTPDYSTLLEVIIQTSGVQFTNTGSAMLDSVNAFEPPKSIEYLGKHICFTGKSELGTRKQWMAFIESQGAVFHTNVTQDVDYLIVGTHGSKDWSHVTYGRKIQTAIQRQKQGQKIQVLTEKQWLALGQVSFEFK
jgi:hypothetical protein